MARGSKKSYGKKQKRMAGKIEKSVKARGGKTKDAERIAWATVNKKKKKKSKKKSKKKTSRRLKRKS